MHFKHLETISPPTAGIAKVTAVSWSPNGKKLAVCTADRVVTLFDENGVKKDKFSTKPAEKGPKNYIVRQMAFSPLSDRLAIAQSDNMIFVYKLGQDWGEKKSICNKFQHSSSITSLVWPVKRSNDIVYGLAEGQVKIGQMKTHKPTTLYSSDSFVVAICCSITGTSIVSAHLDGSIFTYSFDSPDKGARLITRHSCPPFAIAWGLSIVVGGNDGRIVFYGEDGSEEQVFDLSSRPENKEFTVAVSNPTGDAIAFGCHNGLHVVTRNKDLMNWEDRGLTSITNLYSVSAIDWRADGDRLVVSNICGAVDIFDVCVKRTLHKGGFELTYVSQSQVIVRQIENKLRIVIKSQYGREILKTNIYKKRFVIAHTADTLLLGDLETLKLSEVPWHGNATEKFMFDNMNACIVYCSGEVSIIEYGIDDVLGSVRTSFTNSHVVSLRINERVPKLINKQSNFPTENKKIAYLLDAQTICIKDLCSQVIVTIPHDSKVDWLELNCRADLLLFRDRRRYLHVFNLSKQSRFQLLNYCTYVQWVPGSDVVVAQNRGSLCVWYNINCPDQVTTISIKGDIEDIERSEGHTEVIVDEGISQAIYPLDESLISFSTAIDDFNLLKAMDILDKLVMTPDVESMWSQLREVSLASNEIKVAQRCCAALGDISLGRYLGEVLTIGSRAESDLGISYQDYYQVRCKLALASKDFQRAEAELLNQGRGDECIEMYQKLQKYEEAIRIAKLSKSSSLIEMRQEYYQYLLDTNQYERAASLKISDCDFIQAINLLLKGGMPGRAAQVLLDNDIHQPLQLLESVATALTRVGMHDKAGEFYERLNELPRALDSYLRGNAFKKAVDLARRCFPAKVVELQEAWGDYLVSTKQIDMAINHFIEAKVNRKAIEAALSARQFSRALQLVDLIDKDTAYTYYKQLARHYEDARQFELAEKCFVSADQPQLAVEMHTRQGNWDRAHDVAKTYMKPDEVSLLYITQAQKLEAKGRLKDAEKLYLTVDEKDLAINMYKKYRRYDEMIRLVHEFRPDLLKETHQFLAQTLEMEGSLKDAEHHYVEAQEWHSAVNMYRSNELWDDAIRVAKFHGGIGACKRVTITLLMAIGVSEGAKFLSKHGLMEAAIDHAAENGAFDKAMELCSQNMPKKMPELYLKHALFLEDDERFQEAEEEFIKAGKPKEAVDMYLHQQDWSNALRVANNHDSSAIPDIYCAQAKVKLETKDFMEAEELYLAASRPDLALSMYQDLEMWNDAMRFAQRHLPHRSSEISSQYQSSQARAGKGTSRSDFLAIGRAFEQSKQWSQAIDAYLSAKIGKVDSSVELEEVWDRAVELSRSYVPARHLEVAIEVSQRLVDLKREESAADILFEVGRHDEAITLCIDYKKFEKAKALSKGNANLKRRVDDAYQSHLISREDTKELVELGQSEVAIDVLAKRGDWNKVWDVAAKEKLSSSSLGKFVLMRVEELLRRKDTNGLNEAVATLSKQYAPTSDTAFNVYRRLVSRLLSRSLDEEGVEHNAAVNTLRDILYQVANQNRSNQADKKSAASIIEMLMVVHYQNLLFIARKLGLKDIAAKCSITLLKYPDYIPADKAYYQAGILCKEQGNINLSFMLLNRYVDVAEAIDAADNSILDSTEFQDADALPSLEQLPSKHYITSEDDREEIRTWVLSMVTDSSIEQRLLRREASRNTLYEGLYSSDKEVCIVTGFPIHPADILEVNNSTANRKDWNSLVSKTRSCPWTNQPQNPLY